MADGEGFDRPCRGQQRYRSFNVGYAGVGGPFRRGNDAILRRYWLAPVPDPGELMPWQAEVLCEPLLVGFQLIELVFLLAQMLSQFFPIAGALVVGHRRELRFAPETE